MQVGRISDKPEERFFDRYGGGMSSPNAAKKGRKPVQAVTFDRFDLSNKTTITDNSWLKEFIIAMPEETIKERIKVFIDSSPEMEEILTEKLIMEEL